MSDTEHNTTMIPLDPGLLAAILADPDSDELRLIAADWWEERGDPRGEFVRIQVELVRLPDIVPAGHELFGRLNETIDALRRRERELLAAHHYAWVDGIGGPEWRTCGLDHNFNRVRVEFYRGSNRSGPLEMTFSRGFVEHFTCDWPAWHDLGTAIRTRQPVRLVKLKTWPNYQLNISRERRGPAELAFYDGWAFTLASREDGLSERGLLHLALAARWPGIVFLLPSELLHPAIPA